MSKTGEPVDAADPMAGPILSLSSHDSTVDIPPATADDDETSGGCCREFLSTLFSGIVEGDEGERTVTAPDGSGADTSDADDPKQKVFPQWVKFLTYAMCFTWCLGCALLVAVYSIQFDRRSIRRSFYNECGELDISTEDAQEVGAWASSILVANLLDFFANQPLSLLLLSLITVYRLERRALKEKERRRGIASLDALEDFDDAGIFGGVMSEGGDAEPGAATPGAATLAAPTEEPRRRKSRSLSLWRRRSKASSAEAPSDREQSRRPDAGSSQSSDASDQSKAEHGRGGGGGGEPEGTRIRKVLSDSGSSGAESSEGSSD